LTAATLDSSTVPINSVVTRFDRIAQSIGIGHKAVADSKRMLAADQPRIGWPTAVSIKYDFIFPAI
jgi:hypothetical protein